MVNLPYYHGALCIYCSPTPFKLTLLCLIVYGTQREVVGSRGWGGGETLEGTAKQRQQSRPQVLFAASLEELCSLTPCMGTPAIYNVGNVLGIKQVLL